MSEFVGKVTKKFFGKGPKSEHGAIYLETEQDQYVLRRKGGNPFYDPELHKLLGKNESGTWVQIRLMRNNDRGRDTSCLVPPARIRT